MKLARLLLLGTLVLASASAEAAAKKIVVITQSKGFQRNPVKRAAPEIGRAHV